MPERTRPYRESLLEDLRDPVEAAAYLNAALEDSSEMFLVALRDVAEAKKMANVASTAGVAREALYKMLSGNGNPRYSSLQCVLHALGIKLTVSPIDSAGPDTSEDPLSLCNAVRAGLPLGKRHSQTRRALK